MTWAMFAPRNVSPLICPPAIYSDRADQLCGKRRRICEYRTCNARTCDRA